MSMVLVSPPLGVVFGYLTEAVILENKIGIWQRGFQIIGFINSGMAVLVFFNPRKYLNIDLAVAQKRLYLANIKEKP